MESRKIVYRETGIVALGVAACTGVMVLVFALGGWYSQSVLYGALLGALLSIGNFFFMAMGTCLAADKAESKDVKGGTVLMRSSYIFRLLVLFVLLVVCAKSRIFNLIALVLPLVFVRPVLTVAEFFRKKEG